jgi:hypothetical protein
MKTILATILLFFIANCTYSQQLRQVNFSGGAKLSFFSFLVDNDVLIRINEDGKLLEWGIEPVVQRFNYFLPKLQPYMGRVDYYGMEADSVSRGKVKSIGTCILTYYGRYETDEKIGKLRSVGSVLLDYYNNFDNKALKGKIRFLGSQVLEYYSSLEDESFRGKIKAIGNTEITYYSIFDDKLNKGKIKSIGSAVYTWYSLFDRSEYRGGLKSGSYRQTIGGVTYILQ